MDSFELPIGHRTFFMLQRSFLLMLIFLIDTFHKKVLIEKYKLLRLFDFPAG